MRRWWRALAVPALLLLILILFYWKIVLTSQYTWLDSPDYAYQVLPWYQFQAAEWHSGRVPLWEAHQWGGQPLIGQAQPGVAYPLNWLLFRMPLRDGKIRRDYVHWYYVFIHYMAALFMYWLCRDLGRSRGAALLGGLVFSLGGWLGSTEWPQMMNGAVWAPLVFLFLLRVPRGERPLASAVLSGAMLGMALLSGHHQIPTFIALACGGVWIYGFLRGGRLNGRLVVPAALFAVFVLLVGALQTLPAYEYGKLAVRWVGGPSPVGWNDPVPYTVHAQYGLYPLSLLGIVIAGFWRNADPYIGLTAVTLALVALAAAWRDWHVRLFAAVALGGLIFSLGWHGVFEGMFYVLLPMVEKARNPSMAIFIFHFGIAILSTYGIDHYSRDEKWARRLVPALVCFGGLIFATLFLGSVMVAQRPMDYDRIAMAGLAALLLAGVYYGWRQGHLTGRAALVSLVLLFILEAGSGGGSFVWSHVHRMRSLNKLSEHTDIASFLKSHKAPVRVRVDEREIPYNFGDWHGIDAWGGYLASLTNNIHHVQAYPNAALLAGTNFYIGKAPLRPDQAEAFTGASGLKVFSDPRAFPRAWSVHEVSAVENWDRLGEFMQQDAAALRHSAVLLGEAPALDTCGAPDEVRLIDRAPSRILVEAEMGCRGMVVVGEVAFPGWQVWVDGKPARMWEAYGFLRGVVVEGGRHRIEMRYRPRSVTWGAACTALGLLGALLAAAVSRPRRKPLPYPGD